MRQNRSKAVVETQDSGAREAAIIATVRPGQLIYFRGTKAVPGTDNFVDCIQSATVVKVSARTVWTEDELGFDGRWLGRDCQRLTGVGLSHGQWFASLADYKAYHVPRLKDRIANYSAELAELEAMEEKQHLQLVG